MFLRMYWTFSDQFYKFNILPGVEAICESIHVLWMTRGMTVIEVWEIGYVCCEWWHGNKIHRAKISINNR